MKQENRSAQTDRHPGRLPGFSLAQLKTISILTGLMGIALVLAQIVAESPKISGWITGLAAIALSLRLWSIYSQRKKVE